MKSKIARESKRALLEDVRKLTYEQRVQAFLTDNRLVAQLKIAGEAKGTSKAVVPVAENTSVGESALLLLGVLLVVKFARCGRQGEVRDLVDRIHHGAARRVACRGRYLPNLGGRIG